MSAISVMTMAISTGKTPLLKADRRPSVPLLYAVVLLYGGHRKELSDGFRHTTNNRMEIMAAIVDLLVRPGEREDWLRQNSPFAGVLRPAELWRLKKEARHATA